MCRRTIDVASQDAAEESSIETSREQSRYDAVIDVLLCPMCGVASPAGSMSCPNCGEDFGTPTGSMWRQGNKTLVMHKNAEMPNRCVKSNRPSTRYLKRKLSWHHPGWYALILVCNMIVYAIAALIVRKTATIYVGLSEEWFVRRQRAILISWTLSLLGIALLVTGIALVDASEYAVAMIPLGIILLLGGLIYGVVRARIVEVKKIKDDYIWLNGCCAEYLDELPEWTGELL
ncbi:hypothetical protein CA54_24140 [Symmachiella macrocystis]|uniref:Uncharacterized protein n=1 Tax=Symmachiella macrocystis TaxID=2527985 RepID=A0A5C6BRR5_9PLAN|nr:hypothetical protein [Symmachiella macrocystis]TWU13579.1 hypothetical protein CA54_24140 [Symmachiella macrocystis]